MHKEKELHITLHIRMGHPGRNNNHCHEQAIN